MKKWMTRRVMPLLLVIAMAVNMNGAAIYAADSVGQPDSGLCRHHTEHTAECGYRQAQPCTHEHTDECYKTVMECVHTHTDDCYAVSGGDAAATDAGVREPDNCTHVCSEESGCIAKVLNCDHTHSENGGEAGTGDSPECGYAAAQPCAYECRICPVEERISALPGEVTAENADAVQAQLEEILVLYRELNEDEQEQVDISYCVELQGVLAGLNEVEPLVDMPLTGSALGGDSSQISGQMGGESGISPNDVRSHVHTYNEETGKCDGCQEEIAVFVTVDGGAPVYYVKEDFPIAWYDAQQYGERKVTIKLLKSIETEDMKFLGDNNHKEDGDMNSDNYRVMCMEKGNVTLEMGTDVMLSSQSVDSVIHVYGGTFTLKNGTIESTGGEYKRACVGLSVSGGKVNIDGGEIKGTTTGINVYGKEANVTINGGVISATDKSYGYGLEVNVGEVNIINGTIKGYNGIDISVNTAVISDAVPKVCIGGGSIESTEVGIHVKTDNAEKKPDVNIIQSNIQAGKAVECEGPDMCIGDLLADGYVFLNGQGKLISGKYTELTDKNFKAEPVVAPSASNKDSINYGDLVTLSVTTGDKIREEYSVEYQWEQRFGSETQKSSGDENYHFNPNETGDYIFVCTATIKQKQSNSGKTEEVKSGEISVHVDRRPLNIKNVESANRDYKKDNDKVNITKVELNGVIDGDKADVSVDTVNLIGIINSPNADSYPKVMLVKTPESSDEMKLNGSKSKNYRLEWPEGEVDAKPSIKIKKLQGELQGVPDNSINIKFKEQYKLNCSSNNDEEDGMISYTVDSRQDESNNPVNTNAVISVASDGTITTHGVGSAVVKVNLKEGKNYTKSEAAITVNVIKAATPNCSMDKSYTSEKGSDGGTEKLNVSENFPEDRGSTEYSIYGKTDDGSILSDVSVDKNTGILTYTVKEGMHVGQEAEIRVRVTMANYEDAIFTLKIRIVEKISISLDKRSLALSVGGKYQLTAITTPEDLADNVLWTSSNNAVASVDSNGNVTAVGAGRAVITATMVNGDDTYTDTCAVTVSSPGSSSGSNPGGSFGGSTGGSFGTPVDIVTKQPFLKDSPATKGWTMIRTVLEKTTADGRTVAIDMNSTSSVPAGVLTAIRGRDVTLSLDMGGGIVWSVNGKNITAEKISNTNFSVKTAAGAIPQDVIKEAAGSHAYLELNLAQKEAFGFPAVLSVRIGRDGTSTVAGGSTPQEYIGMYANLFYYDTAKNSLEFICADRIAQDGTADLPLAHEAGYDYVVILSADPMGGTEAPESPDGAGAGQEPVNPQEPEKTQAQVKSVKLSKTVYTYSGKAKKPVVTAVDTDGRKISSEYYTVSYKNNKKVGIATVTVKFKDSYSGTVKKTFTIRPAGTAVKKLTASAGGFTVKWAKKAAQVSGYQIQYSTSASFKGSSTHSVFAKKASIITRTVKNLKGSKTYYVRIRTYKTVTSGGKSSNIYSAWSTASKVKTLPAASTKGIASSGGNTAFLMVEKEDGKKKAV